MHSNQGRINYESSIRFWIVALIGACFIKAVFLHFDNRPQFFLGDSGVYLNSALTDSRPNDRSYWYGVLIRWVTANSNSLQPLLLFQAICGALSALVAGFIANRIFPGHRTLILLTVLACSLDPIQLIFERYVLTESIALLSFSGLLLSMVLILSGASWKFIVSAAGCSVALISFRASFFPSIFFILIVGPILARIYKQISNRNLVYCLLISSTALSLCWSTTSSLKTGQVILAAWSPLLSQQDFPDPIQGKRFMEGMDLKSDTFFTREITLFRPDGMIHKIRTEIPDAGDLDKFSKHVAFNLISRDFEGVLNLAAASYIKVWDSDYRTNLMKWDIGQNELEKSFRELLKEKFQHEAEELPSPTFSSRFYLIVGHQTVLLALMAPIVFLLITIFRHGFKFNLLLIFMCMVSASMLITIFIFSTLPVVRYLHPLSWMISSVLPAFFLQSSVLERFKLKKN
jgi:hypothetical protein